MEKFYIINEDTNLGDSGGMVEVEVNVDENKKESVITFLEGKKEDIKHLFTNFLDYLENIEQNITLLNNNIKFDFKQNTITTNFVDRKDIETFLNTIIKLINSQAIGYDGYLEFLAVLYHEDEVDEDELGYDE